MVASVTALEAAGGFPYQVGLKNAVITPCILTPTGTCTGHPLCSTAPGACTAYSGVTGTPAGGSGNQVLLRNDVIAQIGLAPGLSYIGGGQSPVFMRVSASVGGASFAAVRGAQQFMYSIAGLLSE